MFQNDRLNDLVFPKGDDIWAASRNDLPGLVYLILSARSTQSRQGLPSGTGSDDNLGRLGGRRMIGSEGDIRSPPTQRLVHRQPSGQDGLDLS